jgi:hypothetical protein
MVMPSGNHNPLNSEVIRLVFTAIIHNVTSRQYIRDVSKRFGEWYQKTNKTEDTN